MLFVLLMVFNAHADVRRYNARVMHAFLLFTPARTVEQHANGLELARSRDRFMLLAGWTRDDSQVGLGALVLGVTTVMTAHAPARLRSLFDGPVHLGPAVFDGGGLGAGVGARWL